MSWVHKGVVCQEEALHAPSDAYQVRLFVSAEDLETDLTALHLRFPDDKERFRRVAQAVERFCAEIEPGSPIVRNIATDQQSNTAGWATAVLLVVGGTLLAPMSGGYTLAAGGLAAIGLRIRGKRAAENRKLPELEHFRQTLLRRYQGHA